MDSQNYSFYQLNLLNSFFFYHLHCKSPLWQFFLPKGISKSSFWIELNWTFGDTSNSATSRPVTIGQLSVHGYWIDNFFGDQMSFLVSTSFSLEKTLESGNLFSGRVVQFNFRLCNVINLCVYINWSYQASLTEIPLLVSIASVRSSTSPVNLLCQALPAVNFSHQLLPPADRHYSTTQQLISVSDIPVRYRYTASIAQDKLAKSREVWSACCSILICSRFLSFYLS